jgi:hypothetical protein
MLRGVALKDKPSHSSAESPVIRWTFVAACAAICFALLLVQPDGALSGQPGQRPSLPQPIGQPVGGGLEDVPIGNSVEDERLLRALNADRQKSMVSDASKLLRLVNDLNAEIVRSKPDLLNPAQLRKVGEIEKLAHSVKDKMSTPVQHSASFQQPTVKMR